MFIHNESKSNSNSLKSVIDVSHVTPSNVKFAEVASPSPTTDKKNAEVDKNADENAEDDGDNGSEKSEYDNLPKSSDFEPDDLVSGFYTFAYAKTFSKNDNTCRALINKCLMVQLCTASCGL